ncbi:MAG: HU family DNA-binding protein [Nitrospinaceae bacterium]|nr:HU family DNA-binding protein [Nitrospinaceae bacterium]
MTRVQLVSKLASRLYVTKKEANLYLTVFLDSIMEKNLQNDGRVVVQGFGSFKVNEYNARVAKKSLTGELIHLPVRRNPSFHAGKELRQRVNEGMDLVNEAEALLNRIPVPENVFSISAGEVILPASGTFISVRPSCGILRLQDATPDSRVNWGISSFKEPRHAQRQRYL